MIEGGGRGRPTFPDLDDAGILVHADPDAIAHQASILRTTAASVATLGRQLVDVQRAGTWDSPAGDTFAREVGSVPASLDAVTDRLDTVAEIFARYSVSLAHTIDDLVAIGRRHRAAVLEDERVIIRLTTAVTEEERVTLERRRDALAQEIAREALAFRARAEEAATEETRVRRQLATEVPDALTDSWFYDTVTGAEAIGDAADRIAAASRGASKALAGPIAAGSALGWVGSVTKKAVYDQGGSWRSVLGQGPRKAITWGLGKGGGLGRDLAEAPARQVVRDRARQVWSPPVRTPAPTKPVNPAPAPPYQGRHAQRRGGLRGWGDRTLDTAVRGTRSGVLKARRKATRVASDQSGLTLAREIRADWAAVAGGRPAGRVVVGVTSAGRVGYHVDEKRRQSEEARSRLAQARSRMAEARSREEG